MQQQLVTIPIIAAQSQNLITTPFRCLLDVFSMIYVDRCTSVSADVKEFHKVGSFKFQFNHNCLFIGFPLNYERPVVSSCCFCFSWYFENHHVMLWSHWLYIFDTVSPLVYFFTPFIHSILIVKMYKRHIFTLLNEVSPVQIYKSESTNKSRPLYLFFTYLQVQYSYSPLTFILNMMISIILSCLVYTSKRCWLWECVLCCKEKFGNVPNDNAGLHFLADHNIWTAKQERLIVTN